MLLHKIGNFDSFSSIKSDDLKMFRVGHNILESVLKAVGDVQKNSLFVCFVTIC